MARVTMSDEKKRIAKEALKLHQQLAPSMTAIQDAIKSLGALGPDMSTLRALTPPPLVLAKELAETGRLIAEQNAGMQAMAREVANTCRAAQDALKQAGGFELAAGAMKGLTAALQPPKELLEAGRVIAGLNEQLGQQQRALASSVLAAHESMKGMGALGLDASTLKALAFPELPRFSLDDGMLASQWALREAAEGMRASTSLIGAAFARALEVPLFLRDSQLPAPEQMRKGFERFVRAAEALAKAGWTFPKEMTIREVVELAEDPGGGGSPDARKLDEWFLEYYACEGGREHRALTVRLLKSTRLASWRAPLRECLCAYKHGLYRVVVPTLFSVIEGLVCEITGAIREKAVKPSIHWKGRTVKPPSGGILEAQWCAVLALLELLWQRYEFNEPPPGSLNRHWTVHGRRPHVGDRADALRLLAAVDFIADAACIERLATRIRPKGRRPLAASDAGAQPTPQLGP